MLLNSVPIHSHLTLFFREARAKAEARKMDKAELTDDMVDEVFQTLCTNGDDDIDYVPDEPEEEN